MKLKNKIIITTVLGICFLTGIVAVDYFVLGGDFRNLFVRKTFNQASLRQAAKIGLQKTETAAPKMRFFSTDNSKLFRIGTPIEIFCSSSEKANHPKIIVEEKETMTQWNMVAGGENVETAEKIGTHVTVTPHTPGIHVFRCKTNFEQEALFGKTVTGSVFVLGN